MTAAVIVSMAALVSCGDDKVDDKGTPVITITTQPAATTTVTVGNISGGLSVTATVTAGATLSYQWYSNTSPNNTSGKVIDGATIASYDFPTTGLTITGSPYYYFCEVNATGGAEKVRSNVATLTISPDQDGSATSPYLVSSAALLAKVGSGTDSWTRTRHYRQTADITLSGNWTPIGTEVAPFTGTYDGGGYSITSLKISGTASYSGLFGAIGANGKVRNVALINVDINTTGNRIGGIAGDSEGGGNMIENCYVTGTVKGGGSVGGVAGSTEGGSIRNCYTTCTVTGNGNNVGGIAGSTFYNAIANCYATGNISGTSYVGGIVGHNESSHVSLCVALNKQVTAGTSGEIGRIVGSNDGDLADNYARSTGMVLTRGGSTFMMTVGATTIHGANATANSYNGTNAGTWWSASGTMKYSSTNWSIANGRLPHLQTIAGAAFKETQNPTVTP